jgi:aromatic-L-amino-acid/L-tryptophan decarboxylase
MASSRSWLARLELSPDDMRTLGYRAVDLLVDHWRHIEQKKPVSRATRAEMDALLFEPIPQDPVDALKVLEHVVARVLPNSDLLTHPRFFAFCPSPSNFVSTVADFLATGYNIFSGGWIGSPGAAEVELLTINWLLELFGLPIKEGGGLYTSGGSVANLTALVAARTLKLGEDFSRGVLYLSDQTHSSNHRAAKVIGLKREQIRILPTNEAFEMDFEALATAVQEDRALGRHPFCVIATAGTTNTGSVDPLESIGKLCRQENLWMHVDGAYGGAARLSTRSQEQARFRGIELANSITIDPHKWLFQPYEIGCLLVRDAHFLTDTFRQSPEYLRDARGSGGEINFFDHGVQLTRGFRALKFYMSLKTFGLNAFREAVTHGIVLAEATEAFLRARPHWEVVSPATLGVINYRYRPTDPSVDEAGLNALNQALSTAIIDARVAMVATTVLREQVVLRMCIVNPRTTFEDIRQTIEFMEETAKTL